MKFSDLKNMIMNNKLPKSMVILKYSDNDFIVNQYLNAMIKLQPNTIYLDNLKSLLLNNDLLEDNVLYIYHTDKLDLNIIRDNLIIICKNVDKDVQEFLNNYIIDVPKLEEWYLKDYITVKLPNLDNDKIDFLFNNLKTNPYRLDNEINKLNLFTGKYQNNIFYELLNSSNYEDIITFSIFELSNAIIKKDIPKLTSILKHLQNMSIEVSPIVSLLEKNFINILNVQTNPKVNPEELGLNYKQFLAVKYNCNVYTNTQLIKILETLFDADIKIKLGKIPYDNMLDYLIISIIGV